MNDQKKSALAGPVIHRRSFIERLGFGVGAAMLSPIASTLVSEAQGLAQVGTRKRAGFFVMGDCFLPHHVAPAEYANLGTPVMNAPTTYTLPAPLAPLQEVRDRIMVLDGLANQTDGQHSTNYGALSCMKGSETGAPPEGITIDQFIANGIGATTLYKSVLISQGRYNPSRNVFASAKGVAEAGYTDPQAMFKKLFGGMTMPGTAMNGSNKEATKNNMMLSVMRADIMRLQKSLAGPEKTKLDTYLSLIADYEVRFKAQSGALLDCKAPQPPGPLAIISTDAMPNMIATTDALWDMATLAMICGMTNVIGASIACGQAHIFCLWQMVGHGDPPAGPNMTIAGMFSRILRSVNALKQVKEGDKTAFDNSAFLYISDNGGGEDYNHHTDKKRWPLVVIGNAGGKLKADGRFMRFPLKAKNQAGVRALADFYSTMAHALGAPTDTFGMGGNEKIQGPITELLA